MTTNVWIKQVSRTSVNHDDSGNVLTITSATSFLITSDGISPTVLIYMAGEGSVKGRWSLSISRTDSSMFSLPGAFIISIYFNIFLVEDVIN